MGKPVRITETICWQCANAVPSSDGSRGCPWSRSFQPVPGWSVRKRKISVCRWVNKKNVYVKIETYHVKKCPLFVPDEGGRRLNIGH